MTRGVSLLFLCAGALPILAETTQAPPVNAVPSPAPVPTIRLENLVDTLDQAALQEAFRLLTSEYIQEKDLDPLEINRAALQGMLERLDFGAMLLTKQGLAERQSPYAFHHAKIGNAIGYVRFGRYTEDEIGKFDAAVKEFQADKGRGHLILDLRSPQAQADFSIASSLLSRFRPPNELLFKIRRPGNDRPTLFISNAETDSCRMEPVLLVDRETGNVGEIIATVLKRRLKCLVIGEQTPGLAVEYRDVPLDDDRILRYAIAEVVLEDDSSIFREGITPDLRTPTALKLKHDIYAAIDGGKTLDEIVFQKQRPRMNEAALVAGTDPELDYYLLLSQDKPTPWDRPPLQDRALQQAVDLLGTSLFLEGGEKKP